MDKNTEDKLAMVLAMRISGEKVSKIDGITKDMVDYVESYVPYMRSCIGKKAKELKVLKDRWLVVDDEGKTYKICYKEYIDMPWLDKSEPMYKEYLDRTGFKSVFGKSKIKFVDAVDSLVCEEDAEKIVKSKKKLYDSIKCEEAGKRVEYLHRLADEINSDVELKAKCVREVLGDDCDVVVVFSPNEEYTAVVDMTDKSLFDDFFVDESGTYISNSSVKICIGWKHGVGLNGAFRQMKPSSYIMTEFYEVA